MNDIKKGRVVVLDDQPYIVMSADFLKKQQRRPVVRSTIKNLRTGHTKQHTFMQSDKIEEADIERKAQQYLYREGENYQFMDQDSYEQVSVSEDTVGEIGRFLLEGQEVQVMFFGEQPVSVELPIKIERKIISAPLGIKGDTTTNVMKEAEIEGGAKVKVPLFIKEGDLVRIDTRTGEYVERA